MAEIEIFVWTGRILWGMVCGIAIVSFLAVCIIAPISAYIGFRRYIWEWLTLGELKQYKATPEQIQTAILQAGIMKTTFPVESYSDLVRIIGEINKELAK